MHTARHRREKFLHFFPLVERVEMKNSQRKKWKWAINKRQKCGPQHIWRMSTSSSQECLRHRALSNAFYSLQGSSHVVNSTSLLGRVPIDPSPKLGSDFVETH